MVGKAQKSHGARCGLYGGCSNGVPPIHFFQTEHRIQSRSRPIRFLGFSNHEKGAPRQEISKWSTVCSTFSRSGWSVVRSAPFAKGGASKKRPSPHLHKVLTRSNKVSPRTFQTALVQARHTSHVSDCESVSFSFRNYGEIFLKSSWILSPKVTQNPSFKMFSFLCWLPAAFKRNEVTVTGIFNLWLEIQV
jgi:hypothetical protein